MKAYHPVHIGLFIIFSAFHCMVIFKMRMKSDSRNIFIVLLHSAIFPISLFKNYGIALDNSPKVALVILCVFLFWQQSSIEFYYFRSPHHGNLYGINAFNAMAYGITFAIPVWDLILKVSGFSKKILNAEGSRA